MLAITLYSLPTTFHLLFLSHSTHRFPQNLKIMSFHINFNFFTSKILVTFYFIVSFFSWHANLQHGGMLCSFLFGQEDWKALWKNERRKNCILYVCMLAKEVVLQFVLKQEPWNLELTTHNKLMDVMLFFYCYLCVYL